DSDEGFSFNMAEFSVKRDPSDKYPFGFGVVITGGEDTQKNHSVGIFRDLQDAPRQTKQVDLQEAYLSYKVPLGSGLTLKAGKFAVTPLKDLSTALNWIVGPEQNSNNTRQRWVTDLTATYAGFKNVTLGANVDVAGEERVPALVATRQDGDASWWGWAIYAAYDWTE